MHTNKLGLEGEKKAKKLLKSKGYKILECNYTCKVGEADIICVKDKLLVFVEVKSRTNDKFGAPSMAVDYRKQMKYSTIAKIYVMQNKLYDMYIQFDIIEYLDGTLNHIENAFSGK